MKRRLISLVVFLAYIVTLIRVMVFKDIPPIKIGHLIFNFGGAHYQIGSPNLIPFTTIVPYLLGSHGWIIAGVNLVGNIAPLVPLGFLLPFVFPKMTWKKSFIIAIASGLTIETMQTILHVGIFDIDDVILNALGVMIGFWVFLLLTKWVRERKYMKILIATIFVIAACVGAFYMIYPWGQPVISGVGAGGQSNVGGTPQSGDLCGGTGGNGQIVSVGNNSFVMKRNDNGKNETINLTSQATIETSAGPTSESDLKIGFRITLVGSTNPDGSFTANAVLVCNATGSETPSGQ
jgi:glycopeptide antibiotics resistance protein